MRSRITPLIVLAILGGAVITMACGSSSSASGGTPVGDVATNAPQAAATTQAVATPTSAPPVAPTNTPVALATVAVAPSATKPPGTPTQSAATAATGQGTTLTIVAKNLLWDKRELTAKPGDATIVMDNQDPGIPHNLHVFQGTESKGQDFGKTDIAAGPVKQTLKLNLTAGDYFLVCDVHPAMGLAKLKVE